VLLARTDADAADLSTSDVDDNDLPFLTGERTPEGFFRTKPGMDQAISRGLAYAPSADLPWCETSTPNLDDAKKFAEAIHKQFPGKLLAYNCSPSFNWKRTWTMSPSPNSSVNWALWATNSSSSPWRASMH